MEKKTYYVSVQSGAVLEDRGATPFEFEIRATEKEIAQLQELFEYKEDAENLNFAHSFVPGIPYHQAEENDLYDTGLQSVYRMIHRLGTDRTRKQIEEMGIL